MRWLLLFLIIVCVTAYSNPPTPGAGENRGDYKKQSSKEGDDSDCHERGTEARLRYDGGKFWLSINAMASAWDSIQGKNASCMRLGASGKFAACGMPAPWMHYSSIRKPPGLADRLSRVFESTKLPILSQAGSKINYFGIKFCCAEQHISKIRGNKHPVAMELDDEFTAHFSRRLSRLEIISDGYLTAGGRRNTVPLLNF